MLCLPTPCNHLNKLRFRFFRLHRALVFTRLARALDRVAIALGDLLNKIG